jgi:hypothetical protein
MAMTISGDTGITFPNASTQAVSATTLGYQTAAEVTASATTIVNNLSLGVGQTWQTFTVGTQRVYGTTYTNITSKPIFLALTSAQSGTQTISLSINGVTTGVFAVTATAAQGTIYGIVPPGGTYVGNQAGGTIAVWAELR